MIQPPDVIAECRRIAPLVSELLMALGAEVRAGLAPRELDARAVRGLLAAGLEPVLKGDHGFPAHTSIGVNDDVLNNAPSDRPLAPGDLVKVALDAKGRGAFAAQAWTFFVPPAAPRGQALARAGTTALARAVAAARPGARVGDVGAAVQAAIEGAGFSVVRAYVGCGIGADLITTPALPGYGAGGHGVRLQPGMVLNLHVIANAGAAPVVVGADGWGAKTADGAESALFTAMAHVGDKQTTLLTPFGPR